MSRSFSELKTVFDLPDYSGNASQRLLKISQGSRSVADYSVKFQTLATETGWDKGALHRIFVQGLNETLALLFD